MVEVISRWYPMNRGSVGQSPDQGGQKSRIGIEIFIFIYLSGAVHIWYLITKGKSTLVWDWLYQAIEIVQENELAHRIPLGLQ